MTYGLNSKIGMSFQSSYGTINTASMHWLQPISESVTLKKTEITRKGMRGIFDRGDTIEGFNSVGGDVNIEADGLTIGAFLQAVMARTTVTSGSLYTHTFKPRTADWDTAVCAEQPFTYHKGFGDTGSAALYSDLCGNDLEIVIANGQLVTSKLSVVGGTFSQVAALTPSYPTNAALNWQVSSISIAGVARNNVDSLTFSFKGALTEKQTLGGPNLYPDRIKRSGARSVEVSGTLLFDDQTDLQKFISQTKQRLLVNVVGAQGITSGYNESITIDVPSMLFTDFPQGVPGPGELSVSFKASGEYNTTSSYTCQITLVNTKAGY